MRITVDVGGCTWLPLCPCGWRGLPDDSRRAALMQGRHHELRAHPRDNEVTRQLRGK